MKIKKPSSISDDIEMWSSHTIVEDELTEDMEITGFKLEFKGNLSEWLTEYLNNPIGSRLHKRFISIFKDWFE